NLCCDRGPLERPRLSREDRLSRIRSSPLKRKICAVAAGLLWEFADARIVHVGDGPRGWTTPLTLSTGGQGILAPTFVEQSSRAGTQPAQPPLNGCAGCVPAQGLCSKKG